MTFIRSSIRNRLSGLTAWAMAQTATVAALLSALRSTARSYLRRMPMKAANDSVANDSAAVGGAAKSVAAPRALNIAEQWSRLSGILTTAISGSETVREMQAAATQQLDLAQYGITTLVDELAAVMALPGYEGPRQSRLATVHAFSYAADAGPRAPLGHALAA